MAQPPETRPEETRHPEARLALQVVAMPRDTNPYGTIFGGVILSYIDQAGFVEARRHGVHRWVTASVERVDFKAPVLLGDVVSLYARTTRLGTTSVGVRIDVEATRCDTGETAYVTGATMTLVSVDGEGRPIPFAAPATAGG